MNAPKYVRPADPAVAQWAEGLDAVAREYFEERAAVREFEGGYLRQQAESLAKAETEDWLKKHRGKQ